MSCKLTWLYCLTIWLRLTSVHQGGNIMNAETHLTCMCVCTHTHVYGHQETDQNKADNEPQLTKCLGCIWWGIWELEWLNENFVFLFQSKTSLPVTLPYRSTSSQRAVWKHPFTVTCVSITSHCHTDFWVFS